MVFSSNIFLFGFMPLIFLVYALAPSNWRNYILFLSSFVFYFYGEGLLFLLLLSYAVFNYFVSCSMHKYGGKHARVLLAVGIVGNLGGLIYFKYANLFFNTAQNFGHFFGSDKLNIILPIGISFYAFQAISYLMDVSTGLTIPPKKFITFGTYLVAFPQLIAGPIVRYVDVEKALLNQFRKVTVDGLYNGMIRFSFGLGKKILIADSVAYMCDKAFSLSSGELSVAAAWVGALAYAMQIYFDFSGYSDMAIGMGLILGFNYPENFNQPYLARNFSEFWSRWHISLSTWFRDYLYIPLGGNRQKTARTLLNLVLVFALCGLWHGAAWHFMAWGLFHGMFLLVERVLRLRYKWQPSGLSGWFYTFSAVVMGWVLFRANSFDAAVHYGSAMLGLNDSGIISNLQNIVTMRSLFALGLALTCSLTPVNLVRRIIKNDSNLVLQYSVISLACMIFSAAIIARYGFNVFIYFQF